MESDNGLKTELQHRLVKYFSDFREEEINGEWFNLRPLRAKVPLIKVIKYDSGSGSFNIEFEHDLDVSVVNYGDFDYLESIKGRLVGLQIKNLDSKDEHEIVANTHSYLHGMIAEAGENNFTNLKLISDLDIEKRKIDFLSDILTNRDQFFDNSKH